MRNRIVTVTSMAVVTMLLSATLANAGPVVRRERQQQQRIAQGARSGELTPGETRKLERQERGIEATRQRAQADGHVGPREQATLTRAQNRASQNIYRLKHNDREAPAAN